MNLTTKNTKTAIIFFAVIIVLLATLYIVFMLNPSLARVDNTNNELNLVDNQSLGLLAVVYAALTVAVPVMIAIIAFLLFIAIFILQNISSKLTALNISMLRSLDLKANHDDDNEPKQE